MYLAQSTIWGHFPDPNGICLAQMLVSEDREKPEYTKINYSE